ncbi:NACHT domain-containing protein [Streptomyces sp. HD1123-B1]|uniref:NACHT domain-containing protein n=1 Tax=Streptomyces huangiella TaxID=3228804 RepID=UPI003D7DBCE0
MRLRGRREPPTVVNQFTGGSAENVVMTGSVQGGVHVHLHRPEARWPARRLGFLVPAAAAAVVFNRTDHAAGRLVGALLMAIAVWRAYLARRQARAGNVFVPEARLDAAATLLASRLRSVYDREERLSRIHDPVPLRVRWAEGDPVLADHRLNVLDGEDGPLDLTGDLADVAGGFARLPLRRLVVLGPAGSGKSVLALRLARSLLDTVKPGEPVPVVMPLASWDATCSGPWEWAGHQLAAQHPELGSTDAERVVLARALLDSGRILPVFDGFDELPRGSRKHALRHVNAALGPGRGLVLTSRAEAYADAVGAADVLSGAAVVCLQPLTVDQLTEFLPRTTRRNRQGPALTTKWEPVLRRLREEPEGPAAARLKDTLSTPLMVALARVAYCDTDADPMDLLDASRFPTRRALERHLLDAYVPAVYRIPLDDRGARGPWNGEQAERWLAFLARHLRANDTQELAWWHLDQARPGSVGALPTAVGLAGLIWAMYLTGGGRAVADGWLSGPLWLTFGEVTLPGLLMWWVVVSPDRLPGPRRLVRLRAWRPWRPIDSLTVPADIGSAPGPRKILRDDRIASLVTGPLRPVQGNGQPWAVSAALLLALPLFWVAWRVYGHNWGHPADSTDSRTFLVMWVAALSLHGLAQTAWGRYAVTRCWLAARGRLPMRLDAFLEDAHRRGVLRHTGGVYLFRHLELRDRLAGDEGPTDHPSPSSSPALARLNSAGQVLTATGLVLWLTAYIPGVEGPYTGTPAACSLLSDTQLRPVMSRPEKNVLAQCAWEETGAGRDTAVSLHVTTYRAQQRESAEGEADTAVSRGTPLRGVGDRATVEIGAARPQPGEEVEFAEGGLSAIVRARAGNVFVLLEYREELADRDRITAVAASLTQQVLHNAVGVMPPERPLTTIPLPKAPEDSRFSRYGTAETTPVLGDATWKPGERTQIYDLAGVPFVFKAPRLACAWKDNPTTWSCVSEESPNRAAFSGLVLAVEKCGRARCTKARTKRFVDSFRWYQAPVSQWKRLDSSTQYNEVTFAVGPQMNWPNIRKIYGTQLQRLFKAHDEYYLLGLRSFAQADRSDLPRKILNDVCAHTAPAGEPALAPSPQS